MGDMMGSDARVSGEICRGGRKPTASASPATPGKAGRAVAEVGGLRVPHPVDWTPDRSI